MGNNKKRCDIFHHNFKNISCYVSNEVSLKRLYFALFDDRLNYFKNFEIGVYISFLHSNSSNDYLLIPYPDNSPPEQFHTIQVLGLINGMVLLVCSSPGGEVVLGKVVLVGQQLGFIFIWWGIVFSGELS